MSEAGIIAQNIRLAPAVGQQADDEFDGKPRPADDRLAGEDLRVEHDAGVFRPVYPAIRFIVREKPPLDLLRNYSDRFTGLS